MDDLFTLGLRPKEVTKEEQKMQLFPCLSKGPPKTAGPLWETGDYREPPNLVPFFGRRGLSP
ncbi:hypothetical protein CRENBAI_018877 [Crenichthys baileyi]|uniref:Uncharacterized protein n=1 Tax=Crenichthys baileyi TaxID=28760 RepID=A0AAV9QWQ9_9TELE